MGDSGRVVLTGPSPTDKTIPELLSVAVPLGAFDGVEADPAGFSERLVRLSVEVLDTKATASTSA
jgi:hypothetical protein